MTTTLYLGRNSNYAPYPHVSDPGNYALTVIPPAGYNKTATGIFQFNIYVSSVYDGVNSYSGIVRLYAGSQSNLSSPGWFLTATEVKTGWMFNNVGAPIACAPSPKGAIDCIAWALDTTGLHFATWDPANETPAIAGKRFALVATLEYQLPSGDIKTITPGPLAVDPCAAVMSCLAM